MTLLKGDDYFAAPELTVTVERRLPQSVFPEHYHDFHEIMLVESGSGVHIFNDHPYTLTAGTVCFVRASDHHLFENVENLRLTNVLFRSPKAFRFIQDVGHFLPQEHHYQSQIHWQLSPHVLAQVLECIAQLEALPDSIEMEHIATRESLFLQLLILLYQDCFQPQLRDTSENKVNQLLQWLQSHYSEEVNWTEAAERFSLALRTLHRQMNHYTGLTPQRYLNRLRLLEARRRLHHSDQSITDIAYACGFSDSNHFSTQFRREFSVSPKLMRDQLR